MFVFSPPKEIIPLVVCHHTERSRCLTVSSFSARHNLWSPTVGVFEVSEALYVAMEYPDEGDLTILYHKKLFKIFPSKC